MNDHKVREMLTRLGTQVYTANASYPIDAVVHEEEGGTYRIGDFLVKDLNRHHELNDENNTLNPSTKEDQVGELGSV